MNAYNTYVDYGLLVIEFTGEIGTYWNESKISIPINGKSLESINKAVEDTVLSNKVFKSTSLLKEFDVKPQFETYLIPKTLFETILRSYSKQRTGLDVPLWIEYDPNDYIAEVSYNSDWWESLSSEDQKAFSNAMWKEFDIDAGRDNFSSFVSLIFGTTEVIEGEAYNLDKGEHCDIAIELPYGLSRYNGELFYVSVFSDGGIINEVEIHADLESAVRNMNEMRYEHFDRETDDARIFSPDGQEVYSFPDEAASFCSDYKMSKEEYVEFAVKLFNDEFDQDEYIEDLIQEYLDNK